MREVYIKLLVYNWDASPRQQIVKHYVKVGAAPSPSSKARHLARRLKQAIAANRNYGAMSWLEKHHSIYGFVERVEGVFIQTTQQVL